DGTRFFVLFPADAGLTETETNGTKPTRRNGETATRRKDKSPRLPLSVSPSQRVAHIMSLMQRGFTRLLHEGQQIDLSSPDDYQRDNFDNVYVLVDRLVARPDVRQRLVDSLETCFREGHGQALVQVAENARLLRFAEKFQ